MSVCLCVPQVAPNQTTAPQLSRAQLSGGSLCASSLEKPLFMMAGTPSWQAGEAPLARLTSRWDKGRPVLPAKLPPHPGTS